MAKARIAPSADDSAAILLGLIRTALPAAINAFAEMTANGPKRRNLQKEFDFVTINQSFSLVSTDNSAEPLLLPYYPGDGYYLPFQACRVGGVDAYFISDRQTMATKELDDGYIYYTVENKVVYLTALDPIPDSTPVAIIGNYVPGIFLDTAIGSIGATSNTWTQSSGYLPTVADVGRQITIQGAGLSSAAFLSTISAVPSPGTVTTASTSGGGASGAQTVIGEEYINVVTEFQDDLVNQLINTFTSQQQAAAGQPQAA